MRSRSGDDAITFIRTRTLPAELRDELKEPLGEVVKEQELECILKNSKNIVSVGDMCSLTLHEMGIALRIAVVDFKIQRHDVQDMQEKIREIGKIVINVDNPPGTITKELWQAVKKAYQMEENVRIEVSGEEDLATIPCIWLAPENTAVVYGLPNIGLVVVLDEHKAKIKVKEVLTRMK